MMAVKVTLALLLVAVMMIVSAEQKPSFSYRIPRETSGGQFEDYEGDEDAEERDESDESNSSSYEDSYESSEAKYNFEWLVDDESTENHFGHLESRDGDKTDGSYFVQLPDGRLMTVTYYVNEDSGFVPVVTFEGEAEYPSQESYESESESDESDSDESEER